jgi:hypothetical protein
MFKKQYIPFGPKKTNIKSSAEHKIISKGDEENMKNIISEQLKIREMLNNNLQYRDYFSGHKELSIIITKNLD